MKQKRKQHNQASFKQDQPYKPKFAKGQPKVAEKVETVMSAWDE